MSTDAQILALLRKLEAEEQELVNQARTVGQVVEKRLAEWRRVHEIWSEKTERLADLRGPRRGQAARQKRIEELSTGSAFIGRLESELKALQPDLDEKKKDLDRANERFAAAELDIKRKQLEKRQVEKLLENRYQAGRVAAEAREEAVQDEMTGMREKTRGRE